ncbi:MAG: hypothetical protein RL065_1433 [Bacteroidota bacterium]|jgi:uncharacterized membrane protein
MKSSAFQFEKYFVGITLSLMFLGGIIVAIPQIRDFGTGLLFIMLIWLIPFGGIQVIHALYLRVNYDERKDISFHLNIYLLSVVIYFASLGILTLFDNLDFADYKNFALMLIGYGTPPSLAFYLLWICWRFDETNIQFIEDQTVNKTV